MNCTHCFLHAEEGDRYCQRCGKRLPISQDPTQCFRCGKPSSLGKDKSFCTTCGESLLKATGGIHPLLWDIANLWDPKKDRIDFCRNYLEIPVRIGNALLRHGLSPREILQITREEALALDGVSAQSFTQLEKARTSWKPPIK